MADLLSALKGSHPEILSSGQIRMMCPFRDKHSGGSGMASMFLTPAINGYHCFSCKSKGRMTTLLTSEFDVPFFEAVEMVHIDAATYVRKKTDFEIDEGWDIVPPQPFLDRGYSVATLAYFQVGEMSDGTICIPIYSRDDLKGVIYQIREEGKDKRVWHSEGLPKAEILYNLNKNYTYTVLVEGPTDVWRIFQHKHNACGGLGSDLSAEQADLLKGFEIVYMMGDNDEAGIRYNEIAYQRLKNHVTVLFIPYLTEDPGDISLREFVKGFRNAADYVTYSTAMMDHPEYLKIQQEVKDRILKEDY